MSLLARHAFVAEPPAQYLARPPAVVDCSMLCAVLFDEPERGEAERLMSGRRLLAPALLSDEFLNVALKKLRQGMPEAMVRRALVDFADHDIDLLRTEQLPAFDLALRYALSAYDAAYLWLAADCKVPLLTYDQKLGVAARTHLGGLA